MTERFNVAGALLVKLFGRPAIEDEQYAERAGRVRDIGVKIALNRTRLLRRPDPGRLPRDRHGLRRRRGHGRQRHPDRRHAARPGGPARPPLRPAHRPVQRAGRRDDRAGLLRARLRGARPRAAGQGGARRRWTSRTGRSRWSSTASASATRRPTRCRSPRWRRSPPATAARRRAGAARRDLPRARRRAGRPRRPERRRQDDHHQPRGAALRPHPRQRAARRRRPARRQPGLACTTSSAW